MANHSESAIMVDHWALYEVSCGTLDVERRPPRTRTVSSGRRLEDRLALRSSFPICFAAVWACHIIQSLQCHFFGRLYYFVPFVSIIIGGAFAPNDAFAVFSCYQQHLRMQEVQVVLLLRAEPSRAPRSWIP
jgi:hypothetical protein